MYLAYRQKKNAEWDALMTKIHLDGGGVPPVDPIAPPSPFSPFAGYPPYPLKKSS